MSALRGRPELKVVLDMPKEVTRREVFAAFDLWKEVDDFSELSDYAQTLILVWSLMGIIPGEGLGDFYETATAIYRDKNVASLESIGAHKAAEIIQKANKIFARWETEHTNRVDQEWSRFEATGHFVPEEDDRSEADHDELEELERQFCSLVKDIESFLDSYVEHHMAQ